MKFKLKLERLIPTHTANLFHRSNPSLIQGATGSMNTKMKILLFKIPTLNTKIIEKHFHQPTSLFFLRFIYRGIFFFTISEIFFSYSCGAPSTELLRLFHETVFVRSFSSFSFELFNDFLECSEYPTFSKTYMAQLKTCSSIKKRNIFAFRIRRNNSFTSEDNVSDLAYWRKRVSVSCSQKIYNKK